MLTHQLQLDKSFNVIKHIESEKIDISSKNWVVNKPNIYIGNQKTLKDFIIFKSNFDYERIQSLFSNLSSLSIIELFELKNYSLLNLSTTEINLQIHKISSYPIYLCMMTILASIIMFNTEVSKNTLKISIGLFLSVLIYYINNFFNVMGNTEKIPILLSIWTPIILLMFVNVIYTFRINEK